MLDTLSTALGAIAAAFTSLSYIPQVRKAWPHGSTDDLSWKTLAALTCGLAMWIVYGMLCGDSVIICANVIGCSLAGLVLAFKVRDMRSGGSQR